ncbi:SDR family NAD(P)-dependent oxidoreductase [Paenibacillus sp. TH7-28]
MEHLVNHVLEQLKNNEIPQESALAMLSELKRFAQRQARDEDRGKRDTEDIAVIGLGCRFPGADSPEEFWDLLSCGVDSITEFPESRWPIEAFYGGNGREAGKSYSKWGGFIKDADKFAASYFGISAEDAQIIDPQQRLFLEVANETFERAGYNRKTLAKSRTAVIVGARGGTYQTIGHQTMDTFRSNVTGNIANFIAARISDEYDLKGPSFTLDTACSSSLVAVHYAIRSLRTGECDMALAGGVELKVTPYPYVTLSSAGALSPSGKSYVFDRRADGFVPGEGVGAVLLKPLAAARRDGDTIYAVIKGSAVNNDGYTVGMTTPSYGQQKNVLKEAYADSGISPETVTLIEAHGTGTAVGDPIEMKALTEVFRERSFRAAFCAIGSVKTNIGHLDTAAGVAGLIKVVLALAHKKLPPTLNCEFPNPRLDLVASPFYPNAILQDWEAEEEPRRAGVSSFGFGGTNCHLVLEEFAEWQTETASENGSVHEQVFTLSANSEPALRHMIRECAASAAGLEDAGIADFCYTANTGRRDLPYRIAVVSSTREELAQRLDAAERLHGLQTNPYVFSGHCRKGEKRQVAFLFPGQGSQYKQMARRLYETQPVFRETLQRCNDLLHGELEYPLLDYIYSPELDETLLAETAVTQPALFSIGYALGCMWMNWGIQPHAVMGHSVGEYTAACLAGVWGLEDALRLVAARGRCMQQAPGKGSMAVLYAGREEVERLLEMLESEERAMIGIAAYNGPANQVISGECGVIRRVLDHAGGSGIRATVLQVSHAFHSPLMQPALERFAEVLDTVEFHPVQLPVISNVSGKPVKKGTLDKAYWLSHMVQPVRFDEGVQSLLELGCTVLLETGPSATLTGMAASRIKAPASGIATLNRETEDWLSVSRAVSILYTSGVPVDFANYYAGESRKKVVLPVYPLHMERESFWINQYPLADSVNQQYRRILNSDTDPELRDHKVEGRCLLPAVSSWKMIWEAGIRFHGRVEGLSEITHLAGTVVSAGESAELRVIPTGEDLLGFRLESRISKDDQWSVQVTGRYVLDAADRELPESIGIKRLIKRLETTGKRKDATNVYSGFRERGVDYGPYFRSIVSLWGDDNFALAELKLDESVEEGDELFFHPSIMDSALQTVIGLDSGGKVEEGKTFIPFFAERLSLFGKVPDKAYSLFQVESSNAELIIARITITDSEGTVKAILSGFTLKKLRPPSPISTRAHGKLLEETPRNDYLYRMDWKETEWKTRRVAHPRSGHIAVIMNNSARQSKLVDELEVKGVQAVRIVVAAGESGQHQEGKLFFRIPSLSQEHLSGVWSALDREGIGPDGFLHLAAFAGNGEEMQSESALEQYQERLIFGIQTLITFMSGTGAGKRSLYLAADGLFQAAGEDRLRPENAVLPGLALALRREYSRWNIRLLDVSPERAETADSVIRALNGDHDAEILLLRGSRIYAREFTPIPRISGLAGGWKPEANGTYLITGGLSGIGWELARYLGANYTVNLVLVGRSAFPPRERWGAYLENHSMRDAAALMIQTMLELERRGTRFTIVQGDAADAGAMGALKDGLARSGQRVQGIFHCAGVLRDGLFQGKPAEQIREVLRPKVTGSYVLSKVFAEVDGSAPFMVLFSSIASVFGSRGQAEYAAANAFLDGYAEKLRYQEGIRAYSVNWTLWSEAGMGIKDRSLGMHTAAGIRPISTAEGIGALMEAIAADSGRVLVLGQKVEEIGGYQAANAYLEVEMTGGNGSLAAMDSNRPNEGDSKHTEQQDRRELIQELLLERVAELLEMPPGEIDCEANFLELGLDSVRLLGITEWLGGLLNQNIYPTLLFEYSCILDLAGYLAGAFSSEAWKGLLRKAGEPALASQAAPFFRSPEALQDLEDSGYRSGENHENGVGSSSGNISENYRDLEKSSVLLHAGEDETPVQGEKQAAAPGARDIAIIGVYGRFPGAPDLETFWKNNDDGTDAISGYPVERLGNLPEAERLRGREGGFLEDIDQFDPLFYNISPKEAVYMDPQQRLILEAASEVLEMGGYDSKTLDGIKAGIFIGASQTEYKNLWDGNAEKSPYMGLGNSLCVIANRVSYLLNLKGPSIVVDSACSSSLVAVHMACKSLWSGDSDIAIAGGVQLYLNSSTYDIFDKAGMLSQTSRCRSFDRRADGYVRGEGVGAVLLKPLYLAEKDGDIIYAVIKGSAVNHDGNDKVGISAPNPKAQKEVILCALQTAGVHPETIGYVEAHGTGTSLGDPVEITGLTQAFRTQTDRNSFCALGTAKSSIGHLEAAAGIAGLLRAVGALRHRKLPATLHFDEPNPHIPFVDTPFYVNARTASWERSNHPRRSGVSAFGFGGTNCHVILEEYEESILSQPISDKEPHLLLLSAKNIQALHDRVKRLGDYMDRNTGATLAEICRSAYRGKDLHEEEHLAVFAESLYQLRDRIEILQLKGIEQGSNPFGIFHGRKTNRPNRVILILTALGPGAWEALREFRSHIQIGWVDSCIDGLELDRETLLPKFGRTLVNPWPFREAAAGIILQYALVRRLLEAGLKPAGIFGDETGSVVAGLIDGTIDLHAAAEWLGGNHSREEVKTDFNREIRDWLAKYDRDGVLALECSGNRSEAREWNTVSSVPVVSLFGRGMPARSALLNAYGALYAAGYEVHWESREDLNGTRKIPLPPYPYQKKKYWPDFGDKSETSTPTGYFPPYTASGSQPAPMQSEPVQLAKINGGDNSAAGLLYTWDWVEQAPFLPGSVPATNGLWLIFSVGDGFSAGIVREMRERGFQVVEVTEGTEYGESLQSVRINPNDPEHYERLFASLAGPVALSGIIHLWATGPKSDRWAEIKDLEGDLARGLYSIYHIGRRLTAFSRNISLYAVTEGAHRYQVTGQPVFPDRLALSVAVCGLSKELRHVRGIALDFDLAKDRLDERIVILTDTITANPGKEGLYIYRKGQWRIRTLTPALEFSDRRDFLVHGGVYLITGGLGGVGSIIAERLAAAGASALILTGRSALPAEQAHNPVEEKEGRPGAALARLLHLKKLCRNVDYYQAEAADASAMLQVERNALRDYGRIDGVVHCAGVAEDAPIGAKAFSSFLRVIRPKIHGSLIAGQLAERNGAFLAMFSSVAALGGNPGQLDYASANAFMDGLAAGGPTEVKCMSINWPYWVEGGMGGDAGSLRRLAEAGLRPLAAEEGTECLMMLLESRPSSNIAVIPLVGVQTSPSIPNIEAHGPFKVEGESETAAYLTGLIARLVMTEEEHIQPDLHLDHYGLDSLIIQDALTEIERHWGCPVEPSVFQDFPTVRSLAKYLTQQYGAPRPMSAVESGSRGARDLLTPIAMQSDVVNQAEQYIMDGLPGKKGNTEAERPQYGSEAERIKAARMEILQAIADGRINRSLAMERLQILGG